MEKLVFEYLSGSNPDVYIKKTKFGHCICVPDKNIAERLVDVWVNSRPVYGEITNSTNVTVLVNKMD